jgi:transposase
MHHVKGEHRNQLCMFSLESSVPANSFVRVIDAFVDVIDLKSFGFNNVDCGEEGRPPFHASVLLKLYLYGYRNGIRTSRRLEREARLNIEAIWLLSGQQPKYHTIADFRKQYKKSFRAIFRRFVYLLKEWDLIEGETIGIDSFKIRAENSLKNNYNEKKIARHLAYIDEKINEYESILDSGD